MYIKLLLILIIITIIINKFVLFSIFELIIILFSSIILSIKCIKDNDENVNNYKLLYSINKLILEARNKKDLFNDICKAIVNYGKFNTCWIGFIDINNNKIIKPEFSYGYGIKFIQPININLKSDVTNENLNCKPPISKTNQPILKFNWKKFHHETIMINDEIIGVLVVYSNNITNIEKKLLSNIVIGLNHYIKTHETNRLYRRIFEKSITPIIITDINNNIIKINSKFTEITGYNQDDVTGKNPKCLSAKKQSREFFQQMWKDINLNGFWSGEVINKKKNGEEFHQHLSITNIHDEDNQVVNRVAAFYDLSLIKEKEKTIEFLLLHDPKTLLYNNKYLDINFQNIINTNDIISFCIVRVNKFKISFGYEIQTELVKQISLRLKSAIRKDDIIIYLDSGDFLVISISKNINTTNILCERLINTSNVPYSLNDNLLINVNINIGIAIYKTNGITLEEILENAEIAVNKSKTIAPNTFVFFDNKMQNISENRIIIATELKNAIDGKALGILYEPIIKSENNKIFAVEAKLYWDSPSLGRLIQKEFIQVAEELGLIIDFECYLFDEIFHDIITFKQFIPDIKIHINLSSKSKQVISYMLNEFSTRPDFICLSFDELDDVETQLINEMKILGVNLIVNNFGIDQNNLISLQKLPISKIRISEQFIKNIDNSNDNMIICESIIGLAHNLKIKTIAEGVATKSEFEILKYIYCDYIQGEYISKPLEKRELLEFFNNFI